jgi:hypothetical protein
MAKTFTASDGSVFRKEILMRTRNRQLQELAEAEQTKKEKVAELKEAFGMELVSWCREYIVYTSKKRDHNTYRITVPGTEVSVFWNPETGNIANWDWEGEHDCTPWQMKRLLDNTKGIRKLLAQEQNRRMQHDADAIERLFASVKKETEEIS